MENKASDVGISSTRKLLKLALKLLFKVHHRSSCHLKHGYLRRHTILAIPLFPPHFCSLISVSVFHFLPLNFVSAFFFNLLFLISLYNVIPDCFFLISFIHINYFDFLLSSPFSHFPIFLFIISSFCIHARTLSIL